jgi:hypothetical protein
MAQVHQLNTAMGARMSNSPNANTVYRKSLKGIDEVAFNGSGLPLRMVSYLVAVDGVRNVNELTAQYPHLPAMGVMLQGLAEQGFLEVMGGAAQSGAAMPPALPVNPSMGALGPQGAGVMMSPAGGAMGGAMGGAPLGYAPQQNFGTQPAAFFDLNGAKSAMVRDVSSILGADAEPVIAKIQNAASKDDLFALMMGIKKIISIYAKPDVAEKFAAKHQAQLM